MPARLGEAPVLHRGGGGQGGGGEQGVGVGVARLADGVEAVRGLGAHGVARGGEGVRRGGTGVAREVGGPSC